MKTSINPISIRCFAFLLFCATTISLAGQALPQIHARFSNPTFDKKSRVYTLDVELTSILEQENLFGMNLRFFYDPSMMEFQQVDQFHQGYGLLGKAPKPYVGNAASGVQFFNFSQALAYVNGAVQLLDERFPMAIPSTGWVKAFRLTFKVPVTFLNEDQFCPSVIWDLEKNNSNGGFLPGSDGLVITVTENQRDSRFVSGPTIPTGDPSNWAYNSGETMPYGNIEPNNCISIEAIVASEDKDRLDSKGFALYQNQPNPFDGKTRISFDLPTAQEASIIFYDVDGAIKDEIKGHYEAGKNHIDIQQKAWMVESNVIYYRLKTDKYTSKTRTMTLVRA